MRSSTIVGTVVALVILTGCVSDGPPDGAGDRASASTSTPPEATGDPSPPTTEPAQPPPPTFDLPTIRRPPRTDGLVLGGDVSWPQCPEGMGIPERPTQGLPMPLPSARFVVLGLTNGPAFTPNPCLDDQV